MTKLQDKEITNVAGGTGETYTTEHNGFQPGDDIWYEELKLTKQGLYRTYYTLKKYNAKIKYWRHNGATVEWFLEFTSGYTEWKPEDMLHHA